MGEDLKKHFISGIKTPKPSLLNFSIAPTAGVEVQWACLQIIRMVTNGPGVSIIFLAMLNTSGFRGASAYKSMICQN